MGNEEKQRQRLDKNEEIKENRHLKSEWKRAQSEHTASDDHWRD